MIIVKDFTFWTKLDWVTYNWFVGCWKVGGIWLIFPSILVFVPAIILGMCLPYYMTQAYGLKIPERFIQERLNSITEIDEYYKRMGMV